LDGEVDMLVRKSRLEETQGDAAVEAKGRTVTVALPCAPGATSSREEEGVRLSFRLPVTLHRRLRMHSVATGGTIVGTVAGWVEEHTPAA